MRLETALAFSAITLLNSGRCRQAKTSAGVVAGVRGAASAVQQLVNASPS
jgi:hypothetical protein